MIKELEFLKIINNSLSSSKYLGDDCAYLKEYNLTVSADAFIEDVHFSRKYMTPYEIASKAMLVNISDILASGAVPKYALITLSGDLKSDFVKEFYRGINDISLKYNVEIIGGDLTKSEKICISITIFGDSKARNISSRSFAKEGYIFAVSGEFGSSAKGLHELKKGLKESYFIDFHKFPPLSPETSNNIALNTIYPYAMIDSSDGLVDCMYKIASSSNVKIEVNYDLIPKKTDNKDFVLYGGEDYALVGAFHIDDFKKIKGMEKIGICSKGKGIFIDNREVEYRGYNHFE